MRINNKIKVAIIITGLGVGGTELRQLTIARHIDRSRFNIDYYCIYDEDNKLIPEFEKLGYNVKIIKIFDYSKHFLLRVNYINIFKLTYLLKNIKYDIVHTQLPHANTVGRLAAVLSGVRCIIATICNMEEMSHTQIFWDRFLSIFTYKIMCISKSVMEYNIKRTSISRSKYITIHNGIDTLRFDRKNIRVIYKEEKGIPGDKFIIGSVGRLHQLKDYRTLINAYKHVHDHISNTILVIVGDGPEKENLMELTSKLGLSSSTIFMGERLDIPEILSCFDIFVMSSVSEGFGNVIVEAMSMQLPVISTDIPPFREIILNNSDGILIPPKDAFLMASAIIRLYEDKDKRALLSVNARMKVNKNFSESVMINRIQQMYEKGKNRV